MEAPNATTKMDVPWRQGIGARAVRSLARKVGGFLLNQLRRGTGIVASEAVRNSSQLRPDCQFVLYQIGKASFVRCECRVGCQRNLYFQSDAHNNRRSRAWFHQVGLVDDGGGNDGGAGSGVIPRGVVGAKGLVGREPGGVANTGGVASPGTAAEPSPDVGVNPGVATYHVPPKLASP